MTIHLRAHHLLCILTYVGRGYSPAFTENYDRVIARLAAGEDIALVSGPDDVCQPLEAEPRAHCHNASVAWRDAQAEAALSPLLAGLEEGKVRLGAPDIERLRAAFAAGDVRAACSGCDWSDLCDAVAGSGYAGVRLC